MKRKTLYWFERNHTPRNWWERFTNCWQGFDNSWGNIGLWCLVGYPMALLSSLACAVGIHNSREFYRKFGHCCSDCGHRL